MQTTHKETIKAYLGEKITRCRFWPRCNFLGTPAVQTDYGFYCQDCALKHRDPAIRESAEKALKYREGFFEANNFAVQSRSQKDIDNRKAELLSIYKADPTISRLDMALHLGITLRTLNNYLAQLKQDGILLFQTKKGSRKGIPR